MFNVHDQGQWLKIVENSANIIIFLRAFLNALLLRTNGGKSCKRYICNFLKLQ